MSNIERARERVGTVPTVLARHGVTVRWNRTAFCPFHTNSVTPALSCFTGRDGKSRFRCHSCGAHGDALDAEAMLSGRPLPDVIREFSR